MRTYPSGSGWRLWDLHIHHPETLFNNGFRSSTTEERWESYLSAIERWGEIGALGITDYYCIDGFSKAQRYKQDGRLTNVHYLLPNIEMRLDISTKNGRPINIHLLVNPEIVDELDSLFFSRLKFRFRDNIYDCTRSGLIRLGRADQSEVSDDVAAFRRGIGLFKLDVDQLSTVLKENKQLRDNVFVAVPNETNSGGSGLQDSSLRAVRENLYRLADIIFSGNPKDRNYFAGKGVDPPETIKEKYRSLKPCVNGCDAHSLDQVMQPALDRFTWIKANPSFEGLRQILYEPLDRVWIGPNPPEGKNGYQVIRRVRFKDTCGDFGGDWIWLNPNLNTIIGGKSSGKSLLLYHIAKTIDPEMVGRLNEDKKGQLTYSFEDDPAFDFEVEWADGTTVSLKDSARSTTRPITYVPQMYINSLAENRRDELDRLIERTIIENYEEFRSVRENLNCEISELTQKINTFIGEYASRESDLRTIKEKRKEFGDKDAVEKSISDIEKQLEELRQTSELSDEETGMYEDLVTRRRELSGEVEIRSQRIRAFRVARDKLEAELRLFLDSVAKRVKDHVLQAHPRVDTETLADIENTVEEVIGAVRSKANEHTSLCFDVMAMETEELRQLIGEAKDLEEQCKPFEEKIRNKELYERLESKRQDEAQKLQQIGVMDAQIVQIRHSLDVGRILEPFAQRYHLYRQLVSQVNTLGEIPNTDGLQVSAKLDLDYERFETAFCKNLDKRTTLETQFGKLFDGNQVVFDENDHLDQVAEALSCVINARVKLKAGFDTESAMKALLGDYYVVSYDVTQDGDDILNMSPGKLGIVLFQLFLHLSNSKDPILIDQPEDNLDNRTIYQELNDFIRQKKVERQLILVTHNANLVVSTDSENVIVANQGGREKSGANEACRFEYVTGALECLSMDAKSLGVLQSKRIRDHVCEILEGGKEAFERRESKYGLSRG